MHIMTKNGWKLLQPKVEVIIEEAPERYSGPIPSEECKRFIQETIERTRVKPS